MAIVPFSPTGLYGIVQDIPPAELPPTVWSDGLNIQFVDGGVTAAGVSLPLVSDMPITPNMALPVGLTSGQLAAWVVTSPAKVYAYVAGALTDITRIAGDYTSGNGFRWNGGVLGGVTVLNNYSDVPQVWYTSDVETPLVDLPNWPSTHRALCLRSYKQYLIALGVSKEGTLYPTLVKWSHPADPGAVPVTWDETDPTMDAGEYPLSETPGHVVDCLPMKDVNIVYKSDSVYGMQWIGGTYIFRFYKIFSEFGAAGRDCVVEYESGKHCVFTGTDLRIHDGQTNQSVLDGKMKKIVRSLSPDQLYASFVVMNSWSSEVWLCFRRSSDGILSADTAIAWNYITGALSLRELDNFTFMANGRVDPPSGATTTWATVKGTWDTTTEAWGDIIRRPSLIRLIGISAENLYLIGGGTQAAEDCFVERKHIGIPVNTDKAPDLSIRKLVTRIWPRITGRDGDVVKIILGKSDHPTKEPVWDAPRLYVIGQTESLPCLLVGKMFSLRLESESTAPWTFSGMDVEVQPAGVF